MDPGHKARDDKSHLALRHLGGVGHQAAELLGLLGIGHGLLLRVALLDLQKLPQIARFHEAFDSARLKACIFIWCGLALYTADGCWTQRRALRAMAMS